MAFKHYDVVRAVSPSDLAKRLTQKLKEGWQPFGSPVAITPYTLMQAIAAEGDVVVSGATEPDWYYVIVLAGQSNAMAYGEGLPLPDSYDAPHPRIKQLARRNTVTPGGEVCVFNDIIPADHCLHDVQDMSTINHPRADLSKGQYGCVGQGLHIAKKLLPYIPNNAGILLVPCCRGGSAFTQGTEGTFSESTGASQDSARWGVGKPLYQDLLFRTKAALQKNPKNVLLAICWMQGEFDMTNASYAQQPAAFLAMVQQFRADLAGLAAQCHGGSPASVTAWQSQGLPLVSGGGKGTESVFDTTAAIQWYAQREADIENEKLRKEIEDLRAASESDLQPGTIDYERYRLTKAQADAQELKNAREEGLVLETELFTYIFQRVAQNISGILVRVPQTLQRKYPDISPVHLDAVKTEIAKASDVASEEAVGEKLDHQVLMDKVVHYTAAVPARVVYLTAGIDSQRNRFEMYVWGWAPGEEAFLVDKIIIMGRPDEEETLLRVDAAINKKYCHADGTEMTISRVCWDTGGIDGEIVYQRSKKHGVFRVLPVKGASVYGKPVITMPKTRNQRGVYLCEVGTDTAKEILYARMKADPTPADEATSYAIHFPDDPEIFSQTEAQQLVAEELVEKWEKGKMRLLWDNKKRRNEALDCLVYAYAALRVSVQRWQLDLAVLAKSREEETTRPTLKELAAKLSGGVNGYSR
ncbi:terminase gpA endonuclease subunit [Escherichia coli]|uniref:terminase gpA endonuclease subunit n=11 Tax=Escherichia coli TaxID=562 RepID=UPI0004D72F9B|nr:terminase gpA endonuclease subunit [Escherichia coli]KDY52182.1 phage terminase large subunit family protein [Escherichia coli 2-460-02_S3_C1]KDY59579.1 phage terminase large subunit family protein [Escherichia coli 2-460-02_S3_C2]KDY62161.1 phage terminase large subunit family protein [Escherichia coli 2-460-02_S3_C3]